MATAAQVLAIAASQIGITEFPPGSNDQKYGAYYGANGQPWCAFFDAWCFMQGGMDMRTVLGTTEIGYCPALVDAYQARGWWHPVTAAQPGDQIFYCWDGSGVAEHTGLVEELIAGPQIVAIEGNTAEGNDSNGGQVERRVRLPEFALGVGRPPYSTPPAPALEAAVQLAVIYTDTAPGVAGAWAVTDGLQQKHVLADGVEAQLYADLGLLLPAYVVGGKPVPKPVPPSFYDRLINV